MMVIFILQLTGGILSFVFQNELGSSMEKEMEDLMKLYNDEESGEFARKTWDEMQVNVRKNKVQLLHFLVMFNQGNFTQLECCGVDSYSDWQVIAGIDTPRSCQCFSGSDNCNPIGFFKEGCYDSLKDFIASIQSALGIVAIVFAAVEV